MVDFDARVFLLDFGAKHAMETLQSIIASKKRFFHKKKLFVF
jgi:hypothetical protein